MKQTRTSTVPPASVRKGSKKRPTEIRMKEAFAAYEQDRDVRKYRKLRANESVDASILGLPGLRLSGRGVDVFEYPDGRLSPIFTAMTTLLDAVLLKVVLERQDQPPSAEEFRFVRRGMKLTQEELAERIGYARESISRVESGSKPIEKTLWAAMRGEAMLYIVRRLREEASESRDRSASVSDQFADLLSRASTIHLPGQLETSC